MPPFITKTTGMEPWTIMTAKAALQISSCCHLPRAPKNYSMTLLCLAPNSKSREYLICNVVWRSRENSWIFSFWSESHAPIFNKLLRWETPKCRKRVQILGSLKDDISLLRWPWTKHSEPNFSIEKVNEVHMAVEIVYIYVLIHFTININYVSGCKDEHVHSCFMEKKNP